MVNFYQSLDNFMANKKQSHQSRKMKNAEAVPKRRIKGDIFSEIGIGSNVNFSA